MRARIAIISDTHGLLRPEVIEILKECSHILHGGDINRESILAELREYGPLYVVRGNNDKGPWAEELPEHLEFEICGVRFYMVHDKKHAMTYKTGIMKPDVIVFGHSHKYHQEKTDGILWLNPGSCGKRRFDLPITMAVMEVIDGKHSVERIDL